MKSLWIIISIILTVIILLPVIVLSSLTNLSALDNTYFKNQNIYLYTGPLLSNDRYAFGNCTYWVYLLRYKLKDPIPSNWGNAIDWNINALKDGYLVDHNPSPGSIMQDPNAPGGLGHVALVIKVTSNSFTISEMNRVGFDEVDTRAINIDQVNKYNFIHDKTILNN